MSPEEFVTRSEVYYSREESCFTENRGELIKGGPKVWMSEFIESELKKNYSHVWVKVVRGLQQTLSTLEQKLGPKWESNPGQCKEVEVPSPEIEEDE